MFEILRAIKADLSNTGTTSHGVENFYWSWIFRCYTFSQSTQEKRLSASSCLLSYLPVSPPSCSVPPKTWTLILRHIQHPLQVVQSVQWTNRSSIHARFKEHQRHIQPHQPETSVEAMYTKMTSSMGSDSVSPVS